MEGIKKSVVASIESIEQVTELFYQQKDKEGYSKFEETIMMLASTLDQLGKYEGKNIDFNEQQFNAKLTEAMNALEDKDVVLLADILKYEISEMLETITLNL